MNYADLAQIIEINSHTGNKPGVDQVAKLFSQWMSNIGYEVVKHNRETIGDHTHYISEKTEGRKVLLLGHFDTVFPKNTFEGFKEDDEWVYGPGACDMKGGNHVLLESLRNLAAIKTIKNIDVLIVSDEETGSDDSKPLTSEIAKNYDLCMVFEAAGVDHEVVIGRKGIATFEIKLTGKAAHAGNHYAKGINANLAAAQLIVSLTELTDLSLGTSVNVGKMTGGIGANTISPKASLIVEARFTNTDERDRVLPEFTQQALANRCSVNGIELAVSGGLQRDVMQPSEAQSELLNEMAEILGSPLKTEMRGGVSDANVVSAADVPTLDGFGPYGDGDHTIHERASKSSFERRIKEVTTILTRFCG